MALVAVVDVVSGDVVGGDVVAGDVAAAEEVADVGIARDVADMPVMDGNVAEAVARLSHEVIRLNRTSHAIRSAMQAQGFPHRPEGVEEAGLALLVHLAKHGPQRTTSLADLACVDPSTVSRQVGSLVKAGLVERLPDPDDRRASLLRATPSGHDALAALRRRRQRAFEALVADWPAADVRRLADLLSRLNDRFFDRRDEVLAIVSSPAEATPEQRS